jgi:hypothetical protein
MKAICSKGLEPLLMGPLRSVTRQRLLCVTCDRRTKEFNGIVAKAFGSSEMLMMEDIRNKVTLVHIITIFCCHCPANRST